MSEWIELKRLEAGGDIYPTSIRAYSIEAVDKISDGSCRLYLDDEHHYSYAVAETYEELMQKIKTAEEPKVVADRFTKEEYALMQSMIPMATSEVHIKQAGSETIKLLESINNKLSEILKEDD